MRSRGDKREMTCASLLIRTVSPFFDLYFCFVVLLSDRPRIPKRVDGMTAAGTCLLGPLIQISRREQNFFA